MMTVPTIILLTAIAFQGECCRINKMTISPYGHDDCSNIPAPMHCPPRYLKHGPMYPPRPIPCPTLPHCDPYPSKITSAVIPPPLECVDPLMAKCCCGQCSRPYPCSCMPIQILPDDCWY